MTVGSAGSAALADRAADLEVEAVERRVGERRIKAQLVEELGDRRQSGVVERVVPLAAAVLHRARPASVSSLRCLLMAGRLIG